MHVYIKIVHFYREDENGKAIPLDLEGFPNHNWVYEEDESRTLLFILRRFQKPNENLIETRRRINLRTEDIYEKIDLISHQQKDIDNTLQAMGVLK